MKEIIIAKQSELRNKIGKLKTEISEADGQLKLIDDLLLSMEMEENKKNITVREINIDELIMIAIKIITESQIERITPINTYLKNNHLQFNGDVKKSLWESGLFDDTGKYWKLKEPNDDLLR